MWSVPKWNELSRQCTWPCLLQMAGCINTNYKEWAGPQYVWTCSITDWSSWKLLIKSKLRANLEIILWIKSDWKKTTYPNISLSKNSLIMDQTMTFVSLFCYNKLYNPVLWNCTKAQTACTAHTKALACHEVPCLDVSSALNIHTLKWQLRKHSSGNSRLFSDESSNALIFQVFLDQALRCASHILPCI